jgi:trimethylamine:corrinoid methyltransferase-like protein
MDARRPVLEFLSPELVDRIVSEAYVLLETRGVTTRHEPALELAAEHGLAVDQGSGQVRMGEEAVRQCLQSAPSGIGMYARSGGVAMALAGVRPHFNPGSAAISVLDPRATEPRQPTLTDCVELARVTAALPYLAAQSTGLVPTDVPRGHADWSRLLAALLYCEKPVVTGTFRHGSLSVMRELLLAIRGTDAALREQPLAIVDCCPSPPLRWGEHIIGDVIDAARWGIPVEFVSMPALGSVGPVTMVGSLIQHTAETLSGVVFSQFAAPGAPIIYGGSPSLFDMRHGTTPMGAVESVMVMCAYAQIGRHLGLPTHGYLGLSDSKVVDAQAGAETTLGAVLGAMAGVNNMSGPGMLELESCLSLGKLVVDNDLCGIALRAAEGIAAHADQIPPLSVFDELLAQGHLLASDHTLHHQREHFYPQTLDRDRRDSWVRRGSLDASQSAAAHVGEILAGEPSGLPPPEVSRELVRIAQAAWGDYVSPRLPGIT